MTDGGEPRDALVERRLELLEREHELRELLRRTRLTVPVWAAGVVFFLWTGQATGSWTPALVMTAFSAVAAAVNWQLRRRRREELREVMERMEALPPPA